MAQRAQKKSVEADEVLRYDVYNEKHGAKYSSEVYGAEGEGGDEAMEEW